MKPNKELQAINLLKQPQNKQQINASDKAIAKVVILPARKTEKYAEQLNNKDKENETPDSD